MTRKARTILTAGHLKSLLEYDPVTGRFTRASGRSRAGQIVGSIDAKGYNVIGLESRVYKAHRLAWLYMTGEWPRGEIDHKDLCRSNNSWGNLREASVSENQCNVARRKTNKSNFKGVSWHPRAQKWAAQIQHKKVKRHLGTFGRAEDAHAAYCAAANQLHREFARVK